VKEGVALRIDREDLFDLLGERPALLPQLLRGVFNMAGTPAAGTTTRRRQSGDEAAPPMRKDVTVH
jgi:hypothetical protein